MNSKTLSAERKIALVTGTALIAMCKVSQRC